MKKLAVLGMGVCIVLAFSSCKSSESAYKKAYEKAKQQELAELPHR
jgi:PBP1b-binding outer membrane lipoprotein LpoB